MDLWSSRALGRSSAAGSLVVGLALLLLFLSSEAHASGTRFLLQLQSGIAESPFTGGDAGPALGVAAGATFKLKRLPVRWYLLANVVGRHGFARALHQGLEVEASRWDIDAFISLRTLVPVFGPIRLYGELGAGRRLRSQSIRRGNGLGDLSESAREALIVVAAGAQARIARHLSLGVRAELDPLPPVPNLASYAADSLPTPNRLAAFLELGVHF